METAFAAALVAGLEQLTAWAELLDEINVFPVADGDTGRNLVLSLAPLRRADQDRERTIQELLLAARGNSGNIAARFLSGLLMAESIENLGPSVREGRDRAWQAVADPRPGTMLTFFDTLVDALELEIPVQGGMWRYDAIVARLEKAVAATTEALPRLKQAGVVDAGALGAFLFFTGFFSALAGDGRPIRPVTELFSGHLRVSPAFAQEDEHGVCIDTVLEIADQDSDPLLEISGLGQSVVVLKEGRTLKVHLHTQNDSVVREKLDTLGKVVRWSSDDLASQTRSFSERPRHQAIHILTDAAGSLSRRRAASLGITLLDSYLVIGGRALPETWVAPEDLYTAMARGEKVSTSQASLAERHAAYQSVKERYPRSLYLCVGSAYTGNHDVATRWRQASDPEGRFQIVDSGAATGRLGILALAAARVSASTEDPDEVIRYVRDALGRCEELIFLDQLKFLAAGGRISKTGALAGDLLKMKPVISPRAEGVKRMGLVRDKAGQQRLALKRLAEQLPKAGAGALILLQYTDNADWIQREIRETVTRDFPDADVLVEPLSVTAGAHMGPGTWAVAFLRDAGKAMTGRSQ